MLEQSSNLNFEFGESFLEVLLKVLVIEKAVNKSDMPFVTVN